ncbi:MAG: hypothetical protein Q9181_005540 [Wetmoreana brouardii]
MLLLTFVLCTSLLRFSLAAYTLQDDYSGANFLSGFTFFTDTDPTAGYVDYVDGRSSGLFSQSGGSVELAVDSSTVASGRGRKSVRVTSKASFNHALIVLDIGHMPGNICGVWPAFWTTGPNWPSNGEIDILEGVNKQSTNKMTLHSDPGCSIYGSNLNSAGGAVYALEWTSDGMKIWGWSGGGAPSDATGNSPDPSGWGSPTGNFPSGSGCEVDTFFKDQQIVFDTTFCGVWAGNTWPEDPGCSGLASTCQDYVQNNPTAFKDAYWTINSLKVYTNGAGTSSSNTSTGNTGDAGTTNPGTNSTEGTDNGTFTMVDHVQSVRPQVILPTTVPALGVNPNPTGLPIRGWGGGGRGRPAKFKRRIRAHHMKEIVIEVSDQSDERGQSEILESGVPELGEKIRI